MILVRANDRALVPRQKVRLIMTHPAHQALCQALCKDVFAKCYGHDVTRRGKKQKKSKTRMRQFGKVEILQSAFIAALKMGDG
jgi:translation elongation factor EF-4